MSTLMDRIEKHLTRPILFKPGMYGLFDEKIEIDSLTDSENDSIYCNAIKNCFKLLGTDLKQEVNIIQR